MKLASALLSLTVLAFAAPSAHADTLLFSLTDGANNVSFNLQTAPGTLTATSTSKEGDAVAFFSNVSVTQNGGALGIFRVSFLLQRHGGGLFISNPYQVLYQTGDVLFSGSVATPTFLLGNYQLTNFFYPSAINGDFSLTISNVTAPVVPAAPAAVTPEPSSFLLLGTGALGMVDVVRRRLVQAAS